MKHTHIMFFIGKGGVGKTTCSVATAIHLADRGLKVLLVSLDPAHNAGDALQLSLSDTKTAITPNLEAIEIDLEQLMDRYLKRTAKAMKESYRYLRVINLENLLDAVRYSPGIEEYATLEALNAIITHDAERYDTIIFDTAPTGLTLRVLSLPTISLRWIEKLTEIRTRILRLRSSVEHIHGKQVFEIDGIKEPLASEEEDDKTMQELLGYRSEIQQVHAVLTNPEMTSVVAVLNPEEMPFVETQRAAETLAKFRIPLKMLIINKVLHTGQIPSGMTPKLEKQEDVTARIRQTFSEHTIAEEHWRPEEPHGLEQLRQFSSTPAEFFQALIAVNARVNNLEQKDVSKDFSQTSQSCLRAKLYTAIKSLFTRKNILTVQQTDDTSLDN